MGRFWGLPGTNVVVYVISMIMIMEEKKIDGALIKLIFSIITKFCELQCKKIDNVIHVGTHNQQRSRRKLIIREKMCVENVDQLISSKF